MPRASCSRRRALAAQRRVLCGDRWRGAGSSCTRPIIRPIISPTRSAIRRRPVSTHHDERHSGPRRCRCSFCEGLLSGRVSLHRYLDLDIAERRRDLRPRLKGRVAAGLDADSLCGIRRALEDRPCRLHSDVDSPLYEGRQADRQADQPLVGPAGDREECCRPQPGFGHSCRAARRSGHPPSNLSRRRRHGSTLTLAVRQTGADPTQRARGPRPSDRLISCWNEAAAAGAEHRGVSRNGADHLLSALAHRRKAEIDAFFETSMPGPRDTAPLRCGCPAQVGFALGYCELRAKTAHTLLQHHGPGRAGWRLHRPLPQDACAGSSEPEAGHDRPSRAALFRARQSRLSGVRPIAACASAWRSATTGAGRRPIACCA